MKKIFTLVLVMAMAITSFAQVKSMSRKGFKPEPAQKRVLVGTESHQGPVFNAPRSIMVEDPVVEDLSYTTYDWQSNMAARNFVAVWPDGYAVMCYTQSTDASTSFSDRGTGLAIWDPEVGEWEYTDARVESVKTGFGSIARYKENGLVLAAHTSNDCRLFIVEDFRSGNREFGEGFAIPTTGDDGRTQDPCWPVVQCSGENLYPPRTRRGLCNDDKGGSAHPATLLRGYKGCSGRSAEMLSGYKGPSAHPADIMTGYRRLRARPLDDLNDDKSPAARQADKNMSRRGQDTL